MKKLLFAIPATTLLAAGPAAGILAAYSQVAYGGSLEICNATKQKLRVAIAYNEAGTGQFVSKGWWGLNACGGCLTVLQQHDTSRYDEVYIHADADGSGEEVIGGRFRYCVSVDRFQYSQAPNCTSKGFALAKVDLNKTPWIETLNAQNPRDNCHTL
jgi:uncharacterized membrane protein